jgi:REP element-mobilizing transposase RayT
MIDARYTTSAGCVFTLEYHLVWCPKYRLNVLVDPVSEEAVKKYTEAQERRS